MVEYTSCPQGSSHKFDPYKKPQKNGKKFQKGIDKKERKWYNNRVAAKKGGGADLWKLNNKRRSTKQGIREDTVRVRKISEILSRELLLFKSKKKLRARLESVRRLKHSREWFDTMISRVWSWLRMNAGGVHNTFKSNGRGDFGPRVSGGRVSNAWAICPYVWDNVWKRTLIPHNAWRSHGHRAKDLLHRDELASD